MLNTTNINKAQIIEHKKGLWYLQTLLNGNPDPGLGQAQKHGWIELINYILTPVTLLI